MATATWGRSLADDIVATVPPCRAGDDAIPEKPSRPPNRSLAYDAATGKTGEIMPCRVPGETSVVRLRPIGGGIEWTALPGDVQLVQTDESGGRP